MKREPKVLVQPCGSPGANGAVSARVYRRLLADIVHCRLEPGRKLRLLPLAVAYGTSTGTLREVLIQLASERLVLREPTLGFQIAPASQTDLFELVKTISWLEEIGIRESVANGDEHWEQDVFAAHRTLSLCPIPSGAYAPGIFAEWEERFLEYHDALVGACRSSILIAHCHELNQRLLRYRNLAAATVPQTDCEHDRLFAMRAAVLERDADLAVELLQSYLKNMVNIVLTSTVVN